MLIRTINVSGKTHTEGWFETWRCPKTHTHTWASLVAQVVKTPPAMPWVRSLDQKDPLEKRMETPSGILASRIPWTEKSGVTKNQA